MGCGNSREKIEDQMMKIKMARIEVQMERYNNLEKLRSMDGRQRMPPLIPDYIDQNFINNYFLKKLNSISNKDTVTRSRRSKSFAVKRKSKIFEKKSSTRRLSRKGLTVKRKSLKL